MNTLSKPRKITVSSSYHKPRWKKPTFKPKITISGDWLQKAGFQIGDKIEININDNQLIINKF